MFGTCSRSLIWVLIAWALTGSATLAHIQEPAPSHPEDTTHSPVHLSLTYILEWLSNVSGGVERGNKTLGSLNLMASIDLERTWGWTGGRIHTHLHANHGGSFSDLVGDFQTVSHIEAPASVNLLEAYYQQSFNQGRYSLLGGLYAVDSEFDTRASSPLFVHSSPGTGGDIGQLGLNGPGIFPYGALGLRLKYQNQGWYAQTALVEGTPGDPDRPHRQRFYLGDQEGFFSITELGHIWSDSEGELGKVALGGWGFSAPFATHGDPNPHASNRGGYLSMEKTFLREDDPTQGLSGFLRVGVADGRINPIENYAGFGLVYTGLFAGRDADRLGLAVSTGFAGEDYLRAGGADGHETAIELTYAFEVSPNLSIQPDLQFVLNPGFDPTLDTAVVLGVRAVAVIGN